METKDDAMALWCSVCRHVHKQGVKCPICGHTGKSRSYKCFKVAFTAFEFTVQRFDCQGQDKAIAGTIEALERANLALWKFVMILRGRIFGQFAKVHLNDPISRHLVSFGRKIRCLTWQSVHGDSLCHTKFCVVGDGPMGVASWRPLFEETGSHVVIIEHFGIVKPKRRQGYANRFLRIVVEVSSLK